MQKISRIMNNKQNRNKVAVSHLFCNPPLSVFTCDIIERLTRPVSQFNEFELFCCRMIILHKEDSTPELQRFSEEFYRHYLSRLTENTKDVNTMRIMCIEESPFVADSIKCGDFHAVVNNLHEAASLSKVIAGCFKTYFFYKNRDSVPV